MRSLVIGSSGRVGTALCSRLRDKGDGVGEFDLVRDAQEDARFAQLPLDSYDRVFLLAWDVGGAKYLNVPGTQRQQLEWNTAILRNVLPQVADAEVHFTFVSSQLATDPDSVYGVTKRLGELWTQAIGGVTVRLWNAYGALEPISQRSQAVSDFVGQAVTTGTIHVLTSGEERRRFVHLSDIADGLDIAASSPDLRGGILDLASPTVHSIREVAGLVAALTGAEVGFGSSPGTQAFLDGYSNVPGWVQRRALDEALADMVDRARSERHGALVESRLDGDGS